MHSKHVSQIMDNTQCNCDARLLWLSYTFHAFPFFYHKYTVTQYIKKSAYTTSKIHTLPQIKLLLGSLKNGRMPYSPFPFLHLFYSTPAPSSLRQPPYSRVKITIINISMNSLTRQTWEQRKKKAW